MFRIFIKRNIGAIYVVSGTTLMTLGSVKVGMTLPQSVDKQSVKKTDNQ